jgi:hypothetical protein
MGVESLSNGVTTGVDVHRSATRPAIARTGAMLLNGQKRASAEDSAVACRTRSADTMPYLHAITKFLVLSDGAKPHPLSRNISQ